MQEKRKTLLLVLILVGALGASLYAYVTFSELRQAAEYGAADVAECRRMIAQIRSLGNRPKLAGTSAAERDVIGRIREATNAAGIPEAPDAGLTRYSTLEAVGIPNSDYREMPVSINIEACNLQQLITFMHHLMSNDPSLRVKEVVLNEHDINTGAELWNADITLGCLIYEPRSNQRT